MEEKNNAGVSRKLYGDFDFDEEKAADVFYTSKIFTKLADTTTKFYLKSWQEIYELLKKEIQK